MSETSTPAGAAGDEYPVLEYLAALETRRVAGSEVPRPDRTVDDLASSEMGEPTDDREALHRDLAAQTPGTAANLERLQEGFIAGAKAYGRRHGMTYEGWLRAGVDPSVLERAGIERETGATAGDG